MIRDYRFSIRDFYDSTERAFCKRLKIKRMERVLLLQGMEYREGEIAKEVARALIFAVDFDLNESQKAQRVS